MFSQESKLAVLESKLNIYEELSREMLSKLEAAVDKISEGNNRIAMILTKHDERIEQSIKTDDLIVKIIDEVKEENRQDHARVIKRIEGLESKLEEVTKYRWIVVGALVLLSFAFSNSHIVVDLLTPNYQPARIERTK
jgi:FtsZ-binding cell division protein ZapB